MANAVAIRIGTTGKNEVKNDFAEIKSAGLGAMQSIADGARKTGDAGEQQAQRLAASYERATEDMLAADRRRAAAAQKLGAVTPQSSVQQVIAVSTGTGFNDNTKSARESAIVMAQLITEQERYTARVDQFRAAIDPAFAAQQRFDREMIEARTLISGGGISLDQYCQKLRQETALLEETTGAQNRAGSSAGAHRAAMQGLSYQVQDTFTQLSMGANVFQVLAIQGGQAAGQFANLEGKAGRVASFFIGPWGLAITGAMLLFGPFVSKLFESNDALADAVQKLKEDAAATDLSTRAKAAYNLTLEGQIALQRQMTEQLDRQIKSQRQLNQESLQQAQTNAENLRGEQEKARTAVGAAEARVSKANEDLRHPPLGADEGYMAGALQLAVKAEDDLKLARATYASAKASADEARKNALKAMIPIATDRAAAAVDPVKAITDKYQDLADAANRRAIAERWTEERLTAQLATINRQKQAETERAQAAKRNDARETVRFGSPVAGGSTSGRFGETRPGHQHGGVDLAVPVGTIVRAVADGVVKVAGARGNYGNVVYVDAGGPEIRDAHLSRIVAEVGQRVSKGDIIGYSGGARGAPGAGNSQGPHVHHEVRVGGKPVNPFGQYAVDAGKTEDRAAALAASAERDRDQAARRAAAVAGMSADLDSAILEAKRASITDGATLAQFGKDQIKVESDKYAAALAAKVETEDLTATQRDELVKRRAVLDGLKVQQIDTDEAARKAAEVLSVQSAANDNQRDLLNAQLSLATSVRERLPLAMSLLDLDQAEERLRLQAIIDREKIGKATAAEADAARSRLGQLDQIYGARAQATARENESPMQAYLRDINVTGDQMNEKLETIGVNGLRSFTDELSDAIVNFKSLGDVSKRVLAEMLADLLKVQLQKSISGLVGSALGLLGVAAGGASSGTSEITVTRGKPFGFASGTENFSGGTALVGEQGQELVDLPAGSKIHNAAATRRILANDNAGAPILHIDASIHAPGADAAKLEEVAANQRAMLRSMPDIAIQAVQDWRDRNHWDRGRA